VREAKNPVLVCVAKKQKQMLRFVQDGASGIT
jgi:hypothetical protein